MKERQKPTKEITKAPMQDGRTDTLQLHLHAKNVHNKSDQYLTQFYFPEDEQFSIRISSCASSNAILFSEEYVVTRQVWFLLSSLVTFESHFSLFLCSFSVLSLSFSLFLCSFFPTETAKTVLPYGVRKYVATDLEKMREVASMTRARGQKIDERVSNPMNHIQ
jgi:hypothetical protein